MHEQRRFPELQYDYDVTHTTEEATQLAIESNREQPVAIGGRLLAIRDQGKIIFGDVFDQSGRIQVIVEKGITPDFEGFAANNNGDWVGVTGRAMLSRRGEPSIAVDEWAQLARTEVPFPDVRMGFKDEELRSRQRYLDLVINSESRERFIQRSKIISIIRGDLQNQGFIEVETPTLQTIYGGAAARPFETHHNALDLELYMRIAPELYLKRLVVGGLTRVFEIGKVFRNEGISTRHNPEFTMMEVYAAYWDGEQQMQLTEKLVAKIAEALHGQKKIEYQGREVDLNTPWPRRTMDSLVSEALGKEVALEMGKDELKDICDKQGVPVAPGYGAGKLLLELYEKTVESELQGPIFVTDYPKEVSPLARDHRERPGYTERFEGIVAGNEICNGFSELNDPREQWERFKDQERTAEYDDEAMPMDYDYVRALQYGLPPTAGLGIGIDRLVMIMTNARSIRDVILFPTMRPDNFKTGY